MSATTGKVALVASTVSLGCNGGPASSTPCSGAQLALILDLVGYGTGPSTGADFFEGSAAAPTLSNTNAALRLNSGCTDTNNNTADFSASVAGPRNSSSALHPCAAAVPEPGSLTLIASGVAALAAARRRRRRP